MREKKDADPQRKGENFGDGFSDGFVPLKSLDLSKCKTIDDIVRGMSLTAFGGREVGEAADALEKMVRDKSCFRVLTLSGAMTVAKMGLVICDMIDCGMVDAVVSTGALMAHGFIEAAGMAHFKYDSHKMADEELYQKGYDRVYDTLELESNLDGAENIIRAIYRTLPQGEETCSWKINRLFGKFLSQNTKRSERGVLKSAYLNDVPVYIPAFTDSEFGLDFGIYRRRMKLDGKPPAKFNPFHDLEDYTARVKAAKRLGIFTIGGGVPRNWAQQVGPYLDIINTRIGEGGAFKRFHYAVRICPEPAHWGGLSGCTYSEGVSWGKFVPVSEGGVQVEVHSDATIAWPFIVKAVMERLERRKI
ncbi:MAG: deoxyhypusine synthase family protein [archaeon]